MTSQLKTLCLLVLLSALIIFSGMLIGGRAGLIIATAIALIMNIASYWYSDSIILRMYNAQFIAPEDAPYLYDALETMAQRANIPTPRLYIINNPTPNAFATGRDPEHGIVVVTQGLLQLLTKDEICAVIGHELGHIANRDVLIQTVAAIMASIITSLAQMAQFTAFFGRSSNEEGDSNLVQVLLFSFLAPLAATLIQFAISRSREYLADDAGAFLHGNPRDLASALRKIQDYAQNESLNASPTTAHLFIISPLHAQDMLSLFSTHPPTEKRIKRLLQKE